MKINIRGIPFDNVTKEEALGLIISRLDSDERCVVFTPNAEIAEDCIRDDEQMKLILSADVLLADGIGIVKASRILETPLKERVPGVEIGEDLMHRLAGTTHSFFILGGKPGEENDLCVAGIAAQKMNEKYGTTVAGYHHGYFKKNGAENDAVLSEIDSSLADVLIVCLGHPEQERWIVSNKDKLPRIRVFLALGGSVDVWAGNVKRAPKVFLKTGTEWLWRLIKEPSRIGRMMKLPKFYLGTKKYKKQMDKEKKS